MFLPHEVVVDVFQDEADAVHAVKQKQHPERVEDHQKDNDHPGHGVVKKNLRMQVLRGYHGDKINGFQDSQEKEQKCYDKNNLKE